ncbi:ATP-binding cassette domain-containing protein [Actinomadura sp. CNU-125]|uniref:ATP-binding cassette domain-containing protein n=1 Tax=Actinomadura sp. CNU-125 TaxID=1904961 RepID=UPI000A51861B|nr:ATP-binding cassette domain-containing protein [Actinomadura sp. CNU-125]
MTAVLEIDGLTRRFGTVVANDDVSLRVRPGEVVGLLGHNGAGKTTLVSQVVGLLRPDAGRITVGGVDAVARPAAARRMAALQPQAHVPIDGLTLTAAITVAARLRGLDAGRAGAAPGGWWPNSASGRGRTGARCPKGAACPAGYGASPDSRWPSSAARRW